MVRPVRVWLPAFLTLRIPQLPERWQNKHCISKSSTVGEKIINYRDDEGVATMTDPDMEKEAETDDELGVEATARRLRGSSRRVW